MMSDNPFFVCEGKIKCCDSSSSVFLKKIMFNNLVSIILFVCCGFPRLLHVNNICIVQVLVDPVVMLHTCSTKQLAHVALCFSPVHMVLETGLEKW